jgi:anti-sigma factor RsiW
MDCNDARPLLCALIDRELPAGQALHVERHLTTCPECRREEEALRAVSRATRSADYFRAPGALRARIVAALPAVDDAPVRQQEGSDAAPGGPQPRSGGATRSPHPARETPSSNHKEPAASGWAWPWNAWRAPRGGPSGAFGLGSAGPGAAMLGRPAGVAIAAIGAVAIMAAAALALSLALVTHRPAGVPSTNSAFIDEIVQSHVRAQLSGHDIDVVSSDQHTVKPWFNGRLDYAPPVEDLADAGFALTGGRLDYVDHRRVAVLVYRYRKHVIDVYVMPDEGGDGDTLRTPAALTSDGYALARWRAKGMLWWAVSDAEPAVLAQLHTALAARLSQPPASTLQ